MKSISSKHKQIAVAMALAGVVRLAPEALAQPVDPPRILLRSEGGDATQQCSLGDQNGDGRAEWYINGRVYFGSDQMVDEPNYVFDGIIVGPRLVGRFRPDLPDLFILHRWGAGACIYMLGDSATFGRPYIVGLPGTSRTMPMGGEVSIPSDFNGDGFHDITTSRLFESEDGHTGIEHLQIHYGGGDFDTVPDWSIRVPYDSNFTTPGWYLSSGYDVNGDGYSDMLVRYTNYPEHGWETIYDLYLGGDPMDTIPAMRWMKEQFDPWMLDDQISLLADINGDGYDEIGMFSWRSYERFDVCRYLIWFGGDEISVEPNIILDGYPMIVGDLAGEIIGGDFNCDGFGDVITANSEANLDEGAFRIYFGGPNWNGGRHAVEVRGDFAGRGEFHRLGVRLGAVNDYDGDGSDDFSLGAWSGWQWLYSGYRNEAVPPPIYIPETYEIKSSIYPNPFNSTLNIDIQLPVEQDIAIDVFDITGRIAAAVHRGRMSAGNHIFQWSSANSGIFIIRILSGSNRIYRKVVCLK